MWAERVVAWATGGHAEGRRACEKEARACPRDVYVYFDNDAKVRAPFDAMGLEQKVRERMGLNPALTIETWAARYSGPQRLKISEPFVPPKPKLLESA